MARMEPIAVEQAPERARELLDELAARGGEPGTMVETMANAPALLRGYLDLNRAMRRSHMVYGPLIFGSARNSSELGR